MSQLKAAADFYWKLTVKDRKFEVRDVARMYGVDATELQKVLHDHVQRELRAAVSRRDSRKGGVA